MASSNSGALPCVDRGGSSSAKRRKPAFADQIAVEQIRPGEFISKEAPRMMGGPGSLASAYGGCGIAVAVSAACASVSDLSDLALYSLVGQFLRPSLTTQKLLITVEAIRDSKRFATRHVVVKQMQKGKLWHCLEVLVDFHAVNQPSMLVYSAKPSQTYSPPEKCATVQELARHAVSTGEADAKVVDVWAALASMLLEHFETRPCPEGMGGQNIYGVMPKRPTDHDRKSITERASADWSRLRKPLTTPTEQTAALAFMMDEVLTFVPLAHNKQTIFDASLFATMDFALRLFAPAIDISNWHLREMKTVAAGQGRTFTEARVWDQQGQLVASMTQQCMLVPRPAAPTTTKEGRARSAL